MSEEKSGSVRDMMGNYASLARRAARYWKRAALLAVLVLAGGMVWVVKKQRTFRSEASAAIHETSAEATQPRGPEEAQAELRARLDQVYGSRANLGRVVDELRLYPWLAGRTSRMKIIEAFQSSIEYRGDGRDAFHVQFIYQDAAVAQQAVRRLLDLYTEQRRQAGQVQARQDLASVDTAIGGLETVLSAQEERLERFERGNHDMVEQVRARRLGQNLVARAHGMGVQFAVPAAAPVRNDPSDSMRTRRLRLRLHALQSRLASISRADTPRDVAPAPVAAPAPAGPVEESERVQGMRRNVTEIRERLSRLRTTYTEEYPDVQITARRLADAERELSAAVAQERRPRGSQPAPAVVAAPASNENRAAQAASIQREIESTRGALGASMRDDTDRIAAARGAPTANGGGPGAPTTPNQATATPSANGAAPNAPAAPGVTPVAAVEPETEEPRPAAGAMSEFERPMGSLVEVEQTWDRLLAELGTTRTRYQTLLARKFELQAVLDTVNSTGADLLRIIDPPSLATEPEPPGRTKLAMIVVALAFALGLGTAVLSAFLDSRLYEPSDLRRWGELPELPAIPEFVHGTPRTAPATTATASRSKRGR